MPYCDNIESKGENFGQGFELVRDDPVKTSINQVATRIMEKSGYQRGKGLGRNLQGERLPVSLPGKHDKIGLGDLNSLESPPQDNDHGNLPTDSFVALNEYDSGSDEEGDVVDAFAKMIEISEKPLG
ncbi:G-patch domain [Sesbania bispinosa]|nr:G-patch domain [Sesbania bispinosa]